MQDLQIQPSLKFSTNHGSSYQAVASWGGNTSSLNNSASRNKMM